MSKPLFLAVDREYLIDILKVLRDINESIQDLNGTLIEMKEGKEGK